jgi:DNA replication initiation complex subunit (GINS family)
MEKKIIEETSIIPKEGCRKCLGKPTANLTEEEEQKLINEILAVLEKQKITFVECHKILSCVGVKLDRIQNYLTY